MTAPRFAYPGDLLGSVSMDVDQLGLFEVPGPEPKAPFARAQRGRNREVWRLTASAEVTVTDADAVHAAARADEGVILAGADEIGADDGQDESEAADAVIGDDVFIALAWLIWPHTGMRAALEAGAFSMLSVEAEATGDTEDRGTATWSVTAKLTDAEALRRLAAEASPDEAGEISASLAVAWQRACDPFGPLRSIEGITWTPGSVVVEHLPARKRG